MRFWTFIKIICALIVIVIVAISVYFTMHVMGKEVPEPIGKIFTQYVPEMGNGISEPTIDPDKVADNDVMIDIEPGDKAFQKAAELLATGKITEAREKLLFLINYYPSSGAAPRAKHILSEMNMDDFLSLHNNPNVTVHKVVRGDSYLAITAKYQTTMDCLMHLNGYLELRSLQPGDEVSVMPLLLRVTIEPKREALTLWNGGTFLKEYRMVKSVSVPTTLTNTKIVSKSGVLNDKKVATTSKDYRTAEKTITLANGLHIVPVNDDAESSVRGFHLDRADTEELALLLRVGNDVEIRP
jgi:LysM domain